MTAFEYRNGELHAEGVALSSIAEQYDTPCFVYSRAAIEQAYDAWDSALEGVPHLVCFAVKANSNLGVLNLLARRGAGFDGRQQPVGEGKEGVTTHHTARE
mgnify:CR=1 FL=1